LLDNVVIGECVFVRQCFLLNVLVESSLFPLDCKVDPASHDSADHAGKKMKNRMRIHMLPPQCVPNIPQMMSLKKLNEWKWRWRAPQFIGQTQSAKKREDDN
jgi:hypothetical protein